MIYIYNVVFSIVVDLHSLFMCCFYRIRNINGNEVSASIHLS